MDAAWMDLSPSTPSKEVVARLRSTEVVGELDWGHALLMAAAKLEADAPRSLVSALEGTLRKWLDALPNRDEGLRLLVQATAESLAPKGSVLVAGAASWTLRYAEDDSALGELCAHLSTADPGANLAAGRQVLESLGDFPSSVTGGHDLVHWLSPLVEWTLGRCDSSIRGVRIDRLACCLVPCASDSAILPASAACPAASCLDILDRGHERGDGTYWLEAGATAPGPYEAHCLMDPTYDGGGWTLILVLSDDGQDTWTWTDRHLLDSDASVLGSLAQLDRDFKSHAYHDVPSTELLFVHAPSGVWASYDLPSSSGSTLADSVAAAGGPSSRTAGTGVPMNAGSLSSQGALNEALL